VAGDRGLVVPMPNALGLLLTGEYRFMQALNGERFADMAATATGVVPAGIKLGNQNNHSVLFGVRYAFQCRSADTRRTCALDCSSPHTRRLLNRVLRLG
jgi:hypothetical protein